MARENRTKYGTASPEDIALTTRLLEAGNITYVGKAKAGSAESDPVWRIFKLTETDSITLIEFADGNDYFDNVWSTYSSSSFV